MTTAELDVLLADLPTGAMDARLVASRQIVGTRIPEELRSVFGDIRVVGGRPRRGGPAPSSVTCGSTCAACGPMPTAWS